VDGLAIILSGLVGLTVGSFLNVVVHRLPRGESVVSPGSHCPSCGTPIRWYHNIPLLSWLSLRGRCASCRAWIGWQYPLVEAATGAIWAGNVAAYGLGPEAARAIAFLTILLAIAVTDARHYVIPDELSLGGAALGIALAALPGALTLPEAVIGAVAGGGALWLVAIVGTWAFRKEAMGGGDIKMMTMIGAFLGWKGALLTVFLGALAGTIVFVPIALKSDKLVPFGLFLALGGALAFYLGEPLLSWYMGFFA
jgi:leader peptidase (prepilin peptidase)/N-methyltransferase